MKGVSTMKENSRRVIGLDIHPDSFAGAVLRGPDPATAQIESTSTRVALPQLEAWAERHTTPEDVLVLEASGNAFAVAGRLRKAGRKVVILDSHQAGKVGKVYCANDRVDAVKIARIYLSGLSALVWQPDQKTLERREVFSAYQAVVKESTRHKQQIRAMLNEHCVRLESGFRLSHPTAMIRLRKVHPWTPVQLMLLEQMHAGLVAARARRQKLRHYMAKEVLNEEKLLRLSRLCGISLITLYGLVAAIGDVTRFANSRKLVAYLGLNPSVCASGNWEGGGALKRHGKGPLRALLIQSAKKLLMIPNPLQKWGLSVASRRGRNKAAVAVARKLAVAVWHVLQGHAIGAIERVERLHLKLFKFATELGLNEIKAQGYESKEAFVQKKLYVLKNHP
jgi:transposase